MLYNNFFTTIWYTPISERDSLVPTRFLLKPLTYRTYLSLYDSQPLADGITKHYSTDTLLYESIVATENIDVDLSSSNWLYTLPVKLYKELLNTIVSLYLPNDVFYKTINLSLELAVNPRFSGDDWNCTKCQEKKLHFQRNCYLVPEEEHDDSFSLQVLDDMVRKCPMNAKDMHIIDAALSARNIHETSSLPEAGGLGDQTTFFAIASQKARSVVEHYKNKQLEEHAAKSRR